MKVLLFADVDKKDPDKYLEGTDELDEDSKKNTIILIEEVPQSSQVLGWNIECLSG